MSKYSQNVPLLSPSLQYCAQLRQRVPSTHEAHTSYLIIALDISVPLPVPVSRSSLLPLPPGLDVTRWQQLVILGSSTFLHSRALLAVARRHRARARAKRARARADAFGALAKGLSNRLAEGPLRPGYKTTRRSVMGARALELQPRTATFHSCGTIY